MTTLQSTRQETLTEDSLVDFLLRNPDFFERHAEVLTNIELSSGHRNRAVSLQERQAEMLRSKIKALESQLVEMMRHGQDNAVIADRMHQWTRQVLLARLPHDVPDVVVAQLKALFSIPQVALKVWGVDLAYTAPAFVAGVSPEVQILASSLSVPYCGMNTGLEAVQWLPDPVSAMSVALVALRTDKAESAFGLLVLASPDPERFQSAMGLAFLERIGDIASAALSRLRTTP